VNNEHYYPTIWFTVCNLFCFLYGHGFLSGRKR